MTSQSDLNPQLTPKKALTVRFQRIAIIGYVGLLLLMPLWLFLIAPEKATVMVLSLWCIFYHCYCST